MLTQRRSGKTNQRSDNDLRGPYERDRTRAIHCPAFRRLQGKTQILGTRGGDFHRTRLTHSLEVASIGSSIARNLALMSPDLPFIPNDDLITVICLLHDIGHPAFGHGGEAALNYMMRDQGGFEGNAQTLRLLTKLEKSYGIFGLDLTRRSLLGILKYPVSYQSASALQQPATDSGPICINNWLPPKGYFQSETAEVEWLLSPFSEQDQQLFQALQRPPTLDTVGKAAYCAFDCSIMNNADDIAYGVHDLEDAIHLRLITREQFDILSFENYLQACDLEKDNLINNLFSKEIQKRKQAIGELVNYFVTSLRIDINHPELINPILRFTVNLTNEAQDLLQFLKHSVTVHVIDSQEARTFEFGGQTIILRLFEALHSNPLALLDLPTRELYKEADNSFEAYRVICDYIANMTDEYAYRFYERLFGFNSRTIFERL